MTFAFLFIFFSIFIVYVIFSKADLYAHEHESSIRKEIDRFDTNVERLKNLDIDGNDYRITDNHLYQ